MQIALHKPARTTPAARAEITPSQDPIRVLARRYTVTEATVRQWKSRTAFNDRSPTAQRLQTTLIPAQEALVVYPGPFNAEKLLQEVGIFKEVPVVRPETKPAGHSGSSPCPRAAVRPAT
ncbi:hypothetical protein ACPUBP_05345 [Methylococcus capsulatus]|uniref:hypothetical protein n=1 Tax=Methylococcus capsulatus TaxID=414 RepID=UPI003CEE32A8